MENLNKYNSKTYAKGHLLLHEGDTPEHLFFLRSGFVKQYVTSSDGKELVIHIYEEGSIFPLMWGINNEVPNYSLETLSECKISRIPRDYFLDTIKKDPEFLFGLTKRLLFGLSGLSKRIEILALHDAHARTNSTLSYLSKHFGSKLNFTHEEIANLTGLSRERVSIEMKKLKDEKLVTYKRKNIKLNS